MKRTLFVVFLLSSIAGYSQRETTYGNWLIEGGEAVFVKVYNQKGDSAQLANSIGKWLKTLGMVKDIDLAGPITLSMDKFIIDYKKFGWDGFNTPAMITDGLWSGRVVISVKENRYRVKITAITHQTSLYTLNGLSINETGVTGTWTEIALTRSREAFKNFQLERIALFGEALEQHFKYKPPSSNDDW